MKISATKHVVIWTMLALVVLVVSALAEPQWFQGAVGFASGNVSRILTQPYFHLGQLPVTLGFLVKAFAFLLALIFFSRLCQRFLQKEIFARTPWDEGQQYAVSRVLGYLIFIFGLVVGLQSLGVDLSSLVVLGGALGSWRWFRTATDGQQFCVGTWFCWWSGRSGWATGWRWETPTAT